jgi:murein L,D-transpeptidase YcbB/YkuD
MGDLGYNNGTLLFDSTLAEALAEFQERHGLTADGNIGKKTWEALRVPVRERVRQILINMERARWVPARVAGNYLAVNIPEFKLHVYLDDSLLWSCNVIVGKSESVFHTVIFNDEMEFVVFSPYWNIPGNILSMEILPALRANPGYLQAHHLEVVDYKGRQIDASTINWKNYHDKFPYIVRERPGANNSLGRVKFLFPNPYEIYLHDTPARSLFKESSRAFSHGCIRVEEPFRLAQFVLKDDTGWTDEKIMAKMLSEKEEFVRLPKRIPVYLVYFTAFVDRSGRLNFRNDVYGHDEKMKNLLFVN